MSDNMRKELPRASYVRAPEQPFQAAESVFDFRQLTTFYDVPGEFGHLLEGQQYGFEALSLLITETYPGCGPPLHTHRSEEAHVLLEGEVSYILGEQQFTVTAPYVVKIPAEVPHTFLNCGSQPLRMVCAFANSRFTYIEIGPNPLLKS